MHLPPLPGQALRVCHYALSLSACSALPVSLSVPQAWIITSKACAGMDCLSCMLSLSLSLCTCCSLPVSLSLCPSGMDYNIKDLCRHGPSVMYALTLSCFLHIAPCLSLSLSLCPSGVNYNIKGQLPSPYTPASVCLPIFSTVGNQYTRYWWKELGIQLVLKK